MKNRADARARITSYTGAGGREGLLAFPPTLKGPIRLLLLLCVAVFLPLGCSPSSGDTGVSTASREITLAHTAWEESYAVAVLTEVVLEDQLGYEVELSEVALDGAVEGVSNGTYDAFQGVWLPGMEDELSGYRGISYLGRWYLGTTRSGFAVPAYMDTRSMRGVEEAGVETVLVLEPEASALEEAPSRFVENYGLRVESFASTDDMISAARPLYEAGEPFVMLAYSPNRMDLEFDLTYIEGEKSLSGLNAPQTLETIAHDDLRVEQPEAHAFLDEITLTESQIASLEQSIREAPSPSEGAEEWVASRGKFVNLWLSKVRAATS